MVRTPLKPSKKVIGATRAGRDSQRYFTTSQKKQILKHSGYECQMCSVPLEWPDFNADHIIPWNRGGPTTVTNGQALCFRCNKEKGNKELDSTTTP